MTTLGSISRTATSMNMKDAPQIAATVRRIGR